MSDRVLAAQRLGARVKKCAAKGCEEIVFLRNADGYPTYWAVNRFCVDLSQGDATKASFRQFPCCSKTCAWLYIRTTPLPETCNFRIQEVVGGSVESS